MSVTYSLHNDEPSVSANGHPSITRIADTEKEINFRKAELGIPPRTILAELQQEDSHATAKGIYICLAKNRKLQLGGQSPICALLSLRGEGENELGEDDHEWWFDFSVDSDDCLNRLFSQYKTLITLLSKFH